MKLLLSALILGSFAAFTYWSFTVIKRTLFFLEFQLCRFYDWLKITLPKIPKNLRMIWYNKFRLPNLKERSRKGDAWAIAERLKHVKVNRWEEPKD